jgi:competence protein ComEA
MDPPESIVPHSMVPGPIVPGPFVPRPFVPGPLARARPVRARVGLGAGVVLVLVGLGAAVLVSAFGPHGTTQAASAPPSAAPTGTSAPKAGRAGPTIYVHVLGAIAKPGLYLLTEGDRAVDAIGAAGGFTVTADQSGVNLARPLIDGEQIWVPNVGDAPAVPPASARGPTAGAKVNLNAADESTLETLPRVGPAMAKRIIDWRTKNGRFTAVEDLMSVTGVGQKTFDQLKDLVTL